MTSVSQQTSRPLNWSRQLSYSLTPSCTGGKKHPGGNGEDPSSRESNSMIARRETIYETINQIREAISLPPKIRSQHQKASKVRASNGEVMSESSKSKKGCKICKHTPVFLRFPVHPYKMVTFQSLHHPISAGAFLDESPELFQDRRTSA